MGRDGAPVRGGRRRGVGGLGEGRRHDAARAAPRRREVQGCAARARGRRRGRRLGGRRRLGGVDAGLGSGGAAGPVFVRGLRAGAAQPRRLCVAARPPVAAARLAARVRGARGDRHRAGGGWPLVRPAHGPAPSHRTARLHGAAAARPAGARLLRLVRVPGHLASRAGGAVRTAQRAAGARRRGAREGAPRARGDGPRALGLVVYRQGGLAAARRRRALLPARRGRPPPGLGLAPLRLLSHRGAASPPRHHRPLRRSVPPRRLPPRRGLDCPVPPPLPRPLSGPLLRRALRGLLRRVERRGRGRAHLCDAREPARQARAAAAPPHRRRRELRLPRPLRADARLGRRLRLPHGDGHPRPVGPRAGAGARARRRAPPRVRDCGRAHARTVRREEARLRRVPRPVARRGPGARVSPDGRGHVRRHVGRRTAEPRRGTRRRAAQGLSAAHLRARRRRVPQLCRQRVWPPRVGRAPHRRQRPLLPPRAPPLVPRRRPRPALRAAPRL
mmetsp:Transcript_28814/g.92649  ORF Transcript_28814/g.92649 Transcript_28814/m.92649 type:complete len:502 (+) Transcript_28814:374-1879(+)